MLPPVFPTVFLAPLVKALPWSNVFMNGSQNEFIGKKKNRAMILENYVKNLWEGKMLSTRTQMLKIDILKFLS